MYLPRCVAPPSTFAFALRAAHFPRSCSAVHVLQRSSISSAHGMLFSWSRFKRAILSGQNNSDYLTKTYFLTSVLASVSRQRVLPPLFAIHLSRHWSRVRVPSKRSDTIFQNLGVLSGVLPSSSSTCMTWVRRASSSSDHGPVLSSAISPSSRITWAYLCVVYHEVPSAYDTCCDRQRQNVAYRD